jgi:hypothetical protein
MPHEAQFLGLGDIMSKSWVAAFALSAVLSVSAGAEDWSSLQTHGSPIFQSSESYLPIGQESATYVLSGYDRYTSRGGSLPSGIILPSRSTSSPTSGIAINNGSLITASCGSVASPGPTYYPSGYFSSGAELLSYALYTGTISSTTCPPGVISGQYNVPISAFARSDTVSAIAARVLSVESSISSIPSAAEISSLSARVSAVEAALLSSSDLTAINARISSAENDLAALATYIPSTMQEMQKEARAGAAMAASLETVAPAPGSKNRLGFNSANYNGETAFSVSYVRQEGQIDVSAGVAISGDEAMIKGGVGLSW